MKTIKTIGLAAIATLALVGCGGSGGDNPQQPTLETHPYDAPTISEADKQSFLNAVNNARAAGRTCGSRGFFEAAPPLEWNTALYTAAYEHGEDMASKGFFSHDGSGTDSDWTSLILELGRGSSFDERASNNGFPYPNVENLATGYSSINSAMNALLSSEGHCANIMFGRFNKLGMAHVSGKWIMELGQSL